MRRGRSSFSFTLRREKVQDTAPGESWDQVSVANVPDATVTEASHVARKGAGDSWDEEVAAVSVRGGSLFDPEVASMLTYIDISIYLSTYLSTYLCKQMCWSVMCWSVMCWSVG